MKTLIWSAGPEPYSAAPPLYRAARAAGFDVDIAGDRSPAGVRELVGVFERGEYDWVFSFALSPKFINVYHLIKQGGTRLLAWYPDQLDKRRIAGWRAMVGCYDVVVCSSRRTANILRDVGINTVWTPQYFELEECLPLPKRLDEGETIYDVCFIGGFDERRSEFMRHLSRRFSVALYGPRDDEQRAVFGHDMAKVYAQSKIAVNVQREIYVLDEGAPFNVSNRVFRAMGSGSLFLHYSTSDLRPVFDLGVDYAAYNDTIDSLICEVYYWLEHDSEREEIALAGKNKVLRDHTLEKRIYQYWKLMEDFK